jgi:SAM-dependent methyltransferase
VSSKIFSTSTKNVIEHNFDKKRMFFPQAVKRPELISNILFSDNWVRTNAPRLKILIVGARTEIEIYSYLIGGFQLKNIFAIDLNSYSNLILLGDVNHLPFKDESFDIVVLGWVLEFIIDFDKALNECLRSLKNSGYVAIGSMYHPKSQNMSLYNEFKSHNDRNWQPESIDYIKSKLKDKIKNTIFLSDVKSCDLDKRGELILIAEVKK